MDNAQVTEADRKAAADLINTFPLSLGWADRDDLPTQLVEAFARHRLERSEPVGCQYPVHGSVTHVRNVECCDFCGHPADTTTPEPVAEIERLRADLNKARGILERLRDFDGWQGTFHAGHAYDAKQEAIAYLKGAS